MDRALDRQKIRMLYTGPPIRIAPGERVLLTMMHRVDENGVTHSRVAAIEVEGRPETRHEPKYDD